MYNFVLSGNDTVPVFKLFIQDYMPGATGEEVKVYLYALFLASEKRTLSKEQISEDTGIDSETVEKAINKWMRKGLISKKGITYSFCVPEAKNSGDASLYTEKEYLDTVSEIMGGRQFSGTEIMTLIDLKEIYHLPEDIVYTLISHVTDPKVKGKRVSMRYIEKIAQVWAEEDVRTQRRANAKIESYNALSSGALRVINKLYGGNSRLPNAAEKELYEKWTKQWNFSFDAILLAVSDASLVQEPSMKYLDAVLKGYFERGIVTYSAMSKEKEERGKTKEYLKEVISALKAARKMITPALETSYEKWREMGFSHKSVLAACEYTHNSGYHSYKKVDELLSFCYEKGIVKDEQVKKRLEFNSEEDKVIYMVMQTAGLSGSVTDQDRKIYRHAAKELMLSDELIMLAADMSSLKQDPRSYMHALLCSWAENGIDTIEKAKKSNIKVSGNKYVGSYIEREDDYDDMSGLDYNDEMEEAHG